MRKMMFFLCGRKNKRAGRLWSEATQRPCPLCVVVMRVLFRFSINKKSKEKNKGS